MQMVQRVKKVGGSLMVRIPKDVAALEGVKQGEFVQLEVRKVRKDWFGAFPSLTPFTKEDRLRSRHE